MEIGVGGQVSRFLQLIRFSHTIFALPFALGRAHCCRERLAVVENFCSGCRLHGVRAHRSDAF